VVRIFPNEASLLRLTSALAIERNEALRLVTDAARYFQEDPLFVDGQGDVVAAPVPLPSDLLEATREGEMPVALLSGEDGLHLVALAPVMGPETRPGLPPRLHRRGASANRSEPALLRTAHGSGREGTVLPSVIPSLRTIAQLFYPFL
jgi:hypothetical protein